MQRGKNKTKNGVSKARKIAAPFFIIVHENFVNNTENPHQYKEIQRIKREEDFREVKGTPSNVRLDIPYDRKILVCGAFGKMCVSEQLYFLKKAGYEAEIYDKAIVSQHHWG